MSDPYSSAANPYRPPGTEPIEAELVAVGAGAVSLPSRPRVWPVFVGFGLCIVLDVIVLFVIFFVLAMSQQSLEELEGMDPTTALDEVVESPLGVWLSLSATSLVLAAVAVGGAMLSPVRFLDRLNLRRPQITWFGMFVAICGTLSVAMIFTAIDGLGLIPQSEVLEEISKFVEESGPVGFLFSVLLIGLAPGLDEELMFRGYMQTRLVQRWGAGVGIVITSILFGVLHMELVQGSFAVAFGLFLGYLTLKTHSIIPAMICHAANNTVSTVSEYVFGGAGEVVEAIENEVTANAGTENFTLLAAGVSVLGLAVWYFARNDRRFAERQMSAGENEGIQSPVVDG